MKQHVGIAVIGALLLAGCSTSGGEKRIDYRQVERSGSLEVPPDLTQPDTGSQLEIPGYQRSTDQQELLPRYTGARMVGDGSLRWLVVNAPAEKIWPKLRGYWKSNGLAVAKSDLEIGVMETEWAENRADLPAGTLDFLREALPFLYSAPTRDKYRIRLERGIDEGTTEIYLSHYGLEEVVVPGTGGEMGDATRWQSRPSDPELENLLYVQLLNHLGMEKAGAEKVIAEVAKKDKRGQLTEVAGRLTLEVNDGFARAWRLVGVALDRVGLVVNDRDRSNGVYYVVDKQSVIAPEADEKGGFLGLFGGDETGERHLKVELSRYGEPIRVTVEATEGSLTTKQRKAYYERLLEALN